MKNKPLSGSTHSAVENHGLIFLHTHLSLARS